MTVDSRGLPRANLAYPTRYRFGWGRRTELGAELAIAGLRRVLVVTDPMVAGLPWFAPLLADAGAAIAGVVDAVSTNPTEAEVLAGLARFRAVDADGVCAIGGGAALDAGKAIALLAALPAADPGDLATLAVGGARARAHTVPTARPLVAVPTTAGSGSELSTGAAIAVPDAGVKHTLVHRSLLPCAVIADAELTVGLPPGATAATGLDALTHAVEALCAPGYHPMADAIAVEAAGMIAAWLPRAVAEPGLALGRSHLLHAAGMAAVAFAKGLGLCHALAHPVGARTGMHHGLTNALFLPHVLEVNRLAIGEACGRLRARIPAVPRNGDAVTAVVRWLRDFTADLGLPARSPVALAADALPELVRAVRAEAFYLATNPRPVEDREILGVLEAVFA